MSDPPSGPIAPPLPPLHEPRQGPDGYGIGKLSRSARHAIALDRRRRIFELRIAGTSMERIAGAMKMSRPAVKKHIDRALREYAVLTATNTDGHRAQELARLDALIASHWGKRHDPRSAEVILKAGKARRELLGIDAAAKLEVTTRKSDDATFDPSRLSDEQLRQLDELLSTAGRREIDVTPAATARVEALPTPGAPTAPALQVVRDDAPPEAP